MTLPKFSGLMWLVRVLAASVHSYPAPWLLIVIIAFHVFLRA